MVSLLLLLRTAAAQQPPPPPIVNGTETSAWPGVGLLAALDLDQDRGSPFCSATLVADGAILTAAHCAEAAEIYAETYDIGFVVGPSIYEIEDYALVDRFTVHPDYHFDDSGVEADVAVGFLEGSVDAAPINMLGSGSDWTDATLTVVGYGLTSDGASDAGTKRTADMPVWFLDQGIVYALDESDPDSPNACSGDSGGAALRETADGLVLAGVVSFVFSWHDAASACVGGGMGAMRVDEYGDWVASQVDGSVQTGGSSGSGDNPWMESGKSCASAPGPGPGGLLVGLAALLVGGRRRRVATRL